MVQHPRNFGKGAAILTDIKLAHGRHMLLSDTDLDYSASDIARILQPVLDDKAEVVYGTRLFDTNIPTPASDAPGLARVWYGYGDYGIRI